MHTFGYINALDAKPARHINNLVKNLANSTASAMVLFWFLWEMILDVLYLNPRYIVVCACKVQLNCFIRILSPCLSYHDSMFESLDCFNRILSPSLLFFQIMDFYVQVECTLDCFNSIGNLIFQIIICHKMACLNYLGAR
jgi:hypothetical protein